ncbi:MAG: hypothetical protein V4438_03030 [Patescibacteria group bacterium]
MNIQDCQKQIKAVEGQLCGIKITALVCGIATYLLSRNWGGLQINYAWLTTISVPDIFVAHPEKNVWGVLQGIFFYFSLLMTGVSIAYGARYRGWIDVYQWVLEDLKKDSTATLA